MSRSEPRASMALLSLGSLVVATALFVGPAAPARATLSNVSPAQGGTLQPGDSTQFSVTTDAFCVQASADRPNYVVTPNLGGICGLAGERTVTISIVTTAVTPPGTYTVTVAETGAGATDEYAWTFTVAEGRETTETTAATTTTTVATTTTSAATTTSTTAEATTTSTVGTSTTTSAPNGETEPTVADVTTTTTVAVTESPAATSTTTSTTAAGTAVSPDDPDDGTTTAPAENGETLGNTGEPEQAPGAELSGLALETFSEPFEPGVTPRFDGVDVWDFVGLFRDDASEPVGAASRPSPAPLLPWATGLLIAVMAAQVVAARRTPAVEGAPAS